MSKLTVTTDPTTGAAIFSVEGHFTREEALDLHREINARGATELIIDFSRVQSFSDAAVPLVVRAIRPRLCRLRGLGLHQERIFRYFGLEVGGETLEAAG